ncbi:MAG: alpha/beta fold hydrolase [Jatrophihabitantaceae bacterium]
MPLFEVETGVRVAYEDRGSGRPLVFVHGWGASGDVWDYQVLDLSERYRVITIDLRGHGCSDKPWGRYDYALFCRDLQALMTGLQLADVTLIGWSMGGHIALKYVHTVGTPVSRLVLTGSGPRFLQDSDAPYGGAAESAEQLCEAIRSARPETIAGLYASNFHRTDLEATRDWFIRIGTAVPAFVGLSSFQSLLAEDLRDVLPGLAIPIAVFSGRHDQIWDGRWSQLVADQAPNATLTYFENSGHVAFIEDRAAWNAALVTFVEATTAS